MEKREMSLKGLVGLIDMMNVVLRPSDTVRDKIILIKDLKKLLLEEEHS
jgi:hypothetical protein